MALRQGKLKVSQWRGTQKSLSARETYLIVCQTVDSNDTKTRRHLKGESTKRCWFIASFVFSHFRALPAFLRGSPGKPLPLRDEYLPHRFVLVFGFLFGASLVFLSPPFSVPDEPAHFCRAYHCSEGKLYAKKGDGVAGDELPASLADTVAMFDSQDVSGNRFRTSWTRIKSASGIALEPQRRQFISFSNTALYSPVPYLPQSLAIGVARLCRLPPLAMFYPGADGQPDRLPALDRRCRPRHSHPQMDAGHGGPDADSRLSGGLAFGRRHDARRRAAGLGRGLESRVARRRSGPPRFVGSGFPAGVPGPLQTSVRRPGAAVLHGPR